MLKPLKESPKRTENLRRGEHFRQSWDSDPSTQHFACQEKGSASRPKYFFSSTVLIESERLSCQWAANLDSVKAGERQWLRFCHSEDEKKASTSLVKSEWKDSAYQEIHLNLLACELELIRFYFTHLHTDTHFFGRERKRDEREREENLSYRGFRNREREAHFLPQLNDGNGGRNGNPNWQIGK